MGVISTYLIDNISKPVTKYFRENLGLKAYLCGGMVRDHILNFDNYIPTDMDIFVSINEIPQNDIENYCKDILNKKFKNSICNGKIKVCTDFYLRGNYIGDDFTFFVYEGRIEFEPFTYGGIEYFYITTQIVFVNNNKYKSLLDVLRSFDIWLCRCAIDVNDEIVILPECQHDIDNKVVTIQKDVIHLKYASYKSAAERKALLRQNRFCQLYNFKSEKRYFLPLKFK